MPGVIGGQRSASQSAPKAPRDVQRAYPVPGGGARILVVDLPEFLRMLEGEPEAGVGNPDRCIVVLTPEHVDPGVRALLARPELIAVAESEADLLPLILKRLLAPSNGGLGAAVPEWGLAWSLRGAALRDAPRVEVASVPCGRPRRTRRPAGFLKRGAGGGVEP